MNTIIKKPDQIGHPVLPNRPTPDTLGQIMETVLVRGDLSPLTPQQRAEYYSRVCYDLGLNPRTKPFEYLHLNGKLILYALKACTDQLRSIHNVSVTDLSESMICGDSVFVVTAHVRNGAGRTDASKGAVNIANLKGEALANAMMKAETKAKRRATLSLCGLGFLDETEVEDIPAAAKTAASKTSISQRAISARDVPIDELPNHSAPPPEDSPSPPAATEPENAATTGMSLEEEAREAARRGREALNALCRRITKADYEDAIKPMFEELQELCAKAVLT